MSARKEFSELLSSNDSRGTKTNVLTMTDGSVVPIGAQGQLTAVEIAKQAGSALLALYDGKEIKHVGKTKLEAAYDAVASRAQDGDIGALEVILDRIVGKPVQATKNFNVTTTLKDFLSGVDIDDENISESGSQHQPGVRPQTSDSVDPFS